MWKKLLIVPAIAVGVLAVVLLMRGRKKPDLRPAAELASAVRTLEVPRVDIRPRAIGYGVARPARVWQAVPQVSGRVVELSPKVREGEFVREGEVLVRIDRTDYDLEVANAEASLAGFRAQLDETHAREKTILASLEIERSSLTLAKAEEKRIRQLVESATVPRSDLDNTERIVLTQGLRVQELENAVSLLEPARAVLKAQIQQAASRLSMAKASVARCEIQAPFNARLGPVKVEQEQPVLAGQVLFSADGTDATEVTAWVPMVGIRQVLSPGAEMIDAEKLAEGIPEKLGLDASVSLRMGRQKVVWDAVVVRVRGVDSQTRSIGLDVSVKNPYRRVIPGVRPPLSRGMYVAVEIRATARENQVVIPRAALHDNLVFLVDDEGRLARRPVVVQFVQGGLALIESGLEGGETIVLSDLVPAVEGMLLAGTDDPEAMAALLEDAAGESELR